MDLKVLLLLIACVTINVQAGLKKLDTCGIYLTNNPGKTNQLITAESL